jgi:hypothetical protein
LLEAWEGSRRSEKKARLAPRGSGARLLVVLFEGVGPLDHLDLDVVHGDRSASSMAPSVIENSRVALSRTFMRSLESVGPSVPVAFRVSAEASKIA